MQFATRIRVFPFTDLQPQFWRNTSLPPFYWNRGIQGIPSPKGKTNGQQQNKQLFYHQLLRTPWAHSWANTTSDDHTTLPSTSQAPEVNRCCGTKINGLKTSLHKAWSNKAKVWFGKGIWGHTAQPTSDFYKSIFWRGYGQSMSTVQGQQVKNFPLTARKHCPKRLLWYKQ